ncbi:diguanylate cyclase (GGDEF)-like protein/PAS domain S-box-containing protein [Halomonas campaniensis]|uniref:cyclic-guanylate-specific phosphodiesterase n=1 Tax=Halomonas campaniensis TaxID=213554 RepID=A0A7W5K6A3_9GAMM|nr:EAL domain-containing protein [Halomonas campaniensis]MBB3332679.1 diguanylate cyclase (GGDEF)-like protein/PAS domain S-box-containing protein [Halomonas campaniensis]
MIDELSSMEAQQEVHELIAQQVPLGETLDAIARWIGIILPEAVVAFMRYDPRHCTLSLTPSRRFSLRYTQRLQDIPVGPGVASFGTAAFLRQPVFTEDIETDPRWEAFRDAARAEGLRACWSSPVLTTRGELLGTFGTYFRYPIAPGEPSRRKLRQAAALVALAILRDRDISERKRQEASLRLLQRGIEATPNGVVMADALRPDTPLVYANQAFYEMTGYRPEEVLGQNCRFLQGPETDPDAVEATRRALTERSDVDVTLLNYRKDGSPFWNRLSISPVFDEHDTCTHFIGIQQDITQQRDHEAQIAYQATHDLLTGLPNRSVLDEGLEQAFARARRQGALAVVMHFDLDGFKTINEGLGHHVGNRLLMAVAERLRQPLAEGQTLARLTGDEFGLLLPDLPDREAANALADRLIEALAAPFEIEGRALHISASIGIAGSDDTTRHAHELLQRADLAMGEAKQQGRNTWQWYQGNVQRISRRNVLLRHDLQVALQQGDQFELHYQPVVEAGSGRMRGLEALLRWHHPSRGMVPPGDFIPLAEQTGQIIPLGRWVLERACRDAAELLADGRRMLPVAVNISSLQFRRDGFLEGVQQALAESGLPPELLELEVTESVLLDGADQAITLIDRLKALGIRVALDDFGTGFSSLSYLRDLPIHKVKLDRAFIQDITTNRSNAAIVEGIITMSHHMDLVVVAEGIETREQQQDLVRRQCDLLQGYRFSRPVPLARLKALPDRLPEPADDR